MLLKIDIIIKMCYNKFIRSRYRLNKNKGEILFMEKVFEMMRKIKAVLPPEKAGRVICENDGHPPKIIILNHTDGVNPLNSKISEEEIERIKAITFVEDVTKNLYSEEELRVRVKAN